MTGPFFDVSGRDGSDGASGIDHTSSIAATGCDGLNGGRGCSGRSGMPAGSIAMKLSSLGEPELIPHRVVLARPIDVEVLVEAELGFTTTVSRVMNTSVEVKVGELISWEAKGGNGGDGGDGGGGQDGGTGAR
jgi:hypothetical protein